MKDGKQQTEKDRLDLLTEEFDSFVQNVRMGTKKFREMESLNKFLKAEVKEYKAAMGRAGITHRTVTVSFIAKVGVEGEETIKERRFIEK